MLYISCNFLWPNITIYVLSYYYQLYPDKSVSYNFVFLVDTTLVLFCTIGNLISVLLLQTFHWHARLVLLIGGFTALLGCYLASYARSLETFLFFYGAVSSTGYGICSFPHQICSWEWFPKHKGLVSGLISGGYGFGNFIFAQISTDLVNPYGKNPTVYDKVNDVTYFDKSVSNRVPYMMRELVWIWVWFLLFGIVFIQRKEACEQSDN